MQESSGSGAQRPEDESRLRRLIDEVSILADRKEIARQMTYFAEDAVMVTKVGSQTYTLSGRDAIFRPSAVWWKASGVPST